MQFQRGSIGAFFRGDPTLKGYWSFNDVLSRDASGNNYHLTDETANGGTAPEKTTGLLPFIHQGVKFNGSNQCFKNAYITNYGRSVTLACWIQPTSVPTAQVWLVGQSGATQMVIDSSGHVMLNGYLSGVWQNISDPNVVETQRPSFYVGTDNGTTFKLYKNGILIAAASKSGTYNNNGLATIIGGYYSAGFRQMYNGKMNEVAIFSRPLDAIEISQYYRWATSISKKDSLIGLIEEKFASTTTALQSTFEKEIKETTSLQSLLEKTLKETTSLHSLLETFKKDSVALTSQLEEQLKSTTALWTELEMILSGADTVALYSLLEKLTYATVSLQTTLEKCKGETVALSTFLQYEKVSPIAIQSDLNYLQTQTLALQAELEWASRNTIALRTLFEKTMQSTTSLVSDLRPFKVKHELDNYDKHTSKIHNIKKL